jgi:hypothetical protein
MENNKKVPEKPETEPPYDPARPLLGVYPKKMKSAYQRDTFEPTFTRVRYGINLAVHQRMSGFKKCGMYT